MWSVALIVGIAVAASVPIMGGGITFAVIIERRRHHRYIQRHLAIAPTHLSSPENQIEVGNDPAVERSKSPRKGTLEPSSETWVTLPSSEAVNCNDVMESGDLSTEPTWVDETNLRRPLKGPIKKKRAEGRRRLKRTTPLQRVLNSPLSAITENSDCSDQSSVCKTTPAQKITTTPSDKDSRGRPSSWSLTINKRRNPSARDGRMSQATPIPPTATVRRSVSFSNITSPAPAEPLPQLPISAVPRSHKPFSPSNSSRSSVDSVGSSVLETIANSPPKPALFVSKTNSQALREFNFGLGPGMRLTSPTHLSPLAERNERGAATASMRASIRCDSDSDALPPINTDRETGLPDLDTAARSTHGFGSGSVNRQASVTDKRLNVPLNSWTSPFDQDPFSSAQRVACAFDESHLINQNFSPSSDIQEDLGCAKFCPIDQMEKESTVKPFLSPSSPTMTQAKLDNAVPRHYRCPPERDTTASRGALGRSALRSDQKKMGKQPSQLKVVSSNTSIKPLEKPQYLFHGSDPVTTATPTTPDSTLNQYWRFDFDITGTPRTHAVTSPFRSYNSPLLPSPKLSSAYIFPLPRHSEVRGPRKLVTSKSTARRRSRTRSSTQQNDHNAMNHVGSDTSRTDALQLHKSIAMLSNYSSQSQFSDRSHHIDQEKENRQPLNLSVAPLKLCPHQSGDTVSNPSTKFELANLTHATLDVRDDTLLRAPASVDVADDTSVWEDASVREDSPDPEIQLRKSNSARLSLPSGNDILVVEGNTFLPPPEERRAVDSVIVNWDEGLTVAGTSHAESRRDHTNSDEGASRSSPKIQRRRSNTRRSLYDEGGFLREQ